MPIMDVKATMEYLDASKPTVLQLFATKGSPAYKIGKGRGHWRVNSEKLECFLIKKSEKWKG